MKDTPNRPGFGSKPAKRYELIHQDTIEMPGSKTLKRIRALIDIPYFSVEKGDLGGYIESEENLPQTHCAWVADEARVYGNARVIDLALVKDNASVYENAHVSGNAVIEGSSHVCGHAQVSCNARVAGEAQVWDRAIILHNAAVLGQARVHDNAYLGDNSFVKDQADIGGHARLTGNSSAIESALLRSKASLSGNSCVMEDAIVSGEAELYGHVVVKGRACVSDATLEGYVTVEDCAVIRGDAHLSGELQIGGNALIESSQDAILISSLLNGSLRVSAYRSAKGGIEVSTDLFQGSIESFLEEFKSPAMEQESKEEIEAAACLIKTALRAKEEKDTQTRELFPEQEAAAPSKPAPKARYAFSEFDVVFVSKDRQLRRIRALVNMPHHRVKAGDLGGYIESEKNLPQDGNGWVAGDAQVYGDAKVTGNARVECLAQVFDKAHIAGNAVVAGEARVFDVARVYGEARVFGYANVYGYSHIKDSAQVCDNAQIHGHATVLGKALIKDSAVLSGYTVARETAVIGERSVLSQNMLVEGRASIEGTHDWMSIYLPTGRVLYAYRERPVGLRFNLGDFTGNHDALMKYLDEDSLLVKGTDVYHSIRDSALFMERMFELSK